MDAPNFKHLVKDKFDARAEYDKDNDRHPKLAAELVRRANLQTGWKILDLACGTGLVSYLAAAEVGLQGFVTGVDISPGMIKQAEAKLSQQACSNISFAVEDLENCSYPENAFDAILCSSAIFYLDMKSFSKKLQSWLKPGGLLAYNTPEEPYTPLLPLMSKLLAARGHTGYNPTKPLSQTHSSQENFHILKDAGLTSIKISTTGGMLLEKPLPVSDYVEKAYQLVAVGFKPFFPALNEMTADELVSLKTEFCSEASQLAQQMLNSDGLVEDHHNDLWVIASKL